MQITAQFEEIAPIYIFWAPAAASLNGLNNTILLSSCVRWLSKNIEEIAINFLLISFDNSWAFRKVSNWKWLAGRETSWEPTKLQEDNWITSPRKNGLQVKSKCLCLSMGSRGRSEKSTIACEEFLFHTLNCSFSWKATNRGLARLTSAIRFCHGRVTQFNIFNSKAFQNSGK